MADQRAGSNLMPLSLTKARHVQVITMEPPLAYTRTTGNKSIHCSKRVLMDAFLKIRQGSRWLLRNISWNIQAEPTHCLILGRPVLQSLGYDNKKMLEAVCARAGGYRDVRKASEQEGIEKSTDGSIATLLRESMRHNRTSAEDDCIRDDYRCAEFRCDAKEEIIAKLNIHVDDALKDGFPTYKKNQLKTLLSHIHVFKKRLGETLCEDYSNKDQTRSEDTANQSQGALISSGTEEVYG